MAMGLLGYAVAGAGEGLGQGIAATGFEAMKQAMEQNRQAALLQMREEMDIAKEKRGQDIKIADEKRREETAKRLREVASPDSAERALVEDAIAYFHTADRLYRSGAYKIGVKK